jgi:hypothetical protein
VDIIILEELAVYMYAMKIEAIYSSETLQWKEWGGVALLIFNSELWPKLKCN